MLNNHLQIKGSLGADPEFRKTQSGKDMVTLSIAVSDNYYDKEAREYKNTETQWFRAAAYGALEVAEARNLKKGSLVNAGGKLKVEEYKDKDGKQRTSVEVVLSFLEEVVRRKKTSNGAGQEDAA